MLQIIPQFEINQLDLSSFIDTVNILIKHMSRGIKRALMFDNSSYETTHMTDNFDNHKNKPHEHPTNSQNHFVNQQQQRLNSNPHNFLHPNQNFLPQNVPFPSNSTQTCYTTKILH